MREWYWKHEDREAEAKMLETMKRLNLYPYGIQEYGSPTVLEMLKGFTRAWWRSYNFCWWKFGFRQSYYDGHNCSLFLWVVAIHWSY